MQPGSGKGRARFVLPGLYLAFALYIWVDFASAPPDGLANVGLFLATLPVTLVGLLLGWVTGTNGFALIPDARGYLLGHAIYYVPATVVTALLFYALGRRIDRRRSSAR